MHGGSLAIYGGDEWNNFILVVFLFLWCPSWGLGSEHTPTDRHWGR